MEGLIIMDTILSRPHRMTPFSRTYINDSMDLMEIIMTMNISLNGITFHRMWKGEKGSLLSQARFNKSSPAFGEEQEVRCCTMHLK